MKAGLHFMCPASLAFRLDVDLFTTNSSGDLRTLGGSSLLLSQDKYRSPVQQNSNVSLSLLIRPNRGCCCCFFKSTTQIVTFLPFPSWQLCVFLCKSSAAGPSRGLGVQSESGFWCTFDTESSRLRRPPSGLHGLELGRAWTWSLFPISHLGLKEQRVLFWPEGSS